jgi:hypothetical protein
MPWSEPVWRHHGSQRWEVLPDSVAPNAIPNYQYADCVSKLIPRESAPPAQEKVVVARSGNTCAYPGCGLILTMGSIMEGDRPKATGKVAHICAASAGGPRYDDSMTKPQRGSADNLIYLCGPHHDAVDYQLDLHTVEFLREAKRTHEADVARAVRTGLGEVTYAELMLVCSVLVAATEPLARVQVDIALPVQQKIQLNQLGPGPVEQIIAGLSQADRVERFIAFQSELNPGFGKTLAARCKSDYYSAVASGLQPDEVFDYLIQQAWDNAGPHDSPQLRAAALAVVAYLFEICEVFERD